MKKALLLCLLLVPTSCRSNDGKKPVESIPAETPTTKPDPVVTLPVTQEGNSEVKFEANQSRKELPRGEVSEFARVLFTEKDLAPTLIVKTLVGDCNFTAYDDRKGGFVLSVNSRSVQKCQGEFAFTVESRRWSEKIIFEINFVDRNPELKLEFSFKDPSTGVDVKAFNKGEVLYLIKKDVELVGKLKYGANVNIELLKDGDSSLKTKCGNWDMLGIDSSIPKRFFGLNSGATLVRFNAGPEVSSDLAEVAKSVASEKGLKIKEVLFAPALAYSRFSFIPDSMTQKGLSAGARASAESFHKPLNDFLKGPGRLVDELALASVCDLINGTGIRAVNDDGSEGPAIRLMVDEAQ